MSSICDDAFWWDAYTKEGSSFLLNILCAKFVREGGISSLRQSCKMTFRYCYEKKCVEIIFLTAIAIFAMWIGHTQCNSIKFAFEI